MSNKAGSMHRVGWESIWNSEQSPSRFASFAAPEDTVVDWANSLPPGAFVFDLGCGVGRHVTYLGGRGFRWLAQTLRRQVCSERGPPAPSVVSPSTAACAI